MPGTFLFCIFFTSFTILIDPTPVFEDNDPLLCGKSDHVVQRVERDRPYNYG